MGRGFRLSVAALSILALSGSAALAQAPIRIIVGVAPGATTDTVARTVGEKLHDILKETVIIENRLGPASRMAISELKRSPADGRTLLVGSNAAFSIVPHIYGDKLDYKTTDFRPVSRLVVFQVGIATGPKTKTKTIAEYVNWVKANPNEASFASPGAGTTSHFAGLMLSKAIGVPLTHIPYKGGAPAMTDIMGGHIPLLATALSDMPQYHRTGQLTILASAGPKRSPAAPDVPTLREQGINIAFESSFDMHALAGTPDDVVARLNKAVNQALADPDVRKRLESMGLEVAGSTSDELAAKQVEEIEMWREPVKDSGFTGG
jgi:tripartite-type tricarboxylate transporter receptor subunit TctC